MNLNSLIGKTIAHIERTGTRGDNDLPYLTITFSDGSQCIIEAESQGFINVYNNIYELGGGYNNDY